MCLTGISEKQFINVTEGEIDQFIATLKERGVSQRIIISDADSTTLTGNHLEYRSIPQELFNSTPQYVYGDTVAFLLWGPPQQALIIKNATLADAMHKHFLLMWHYAKPLERDLVNSNS